MPAQPLRDSLTLGAFSIFLYRGCLLYEGACGRPLKILRRPRRSSPLEKRRRAENRRRESLFVGREREKELLCFCGSIFGHRKVPFLEFPKIVLSVTKTMSQWDMPISHRREFAEKVKAQESLRELPSWGWDSGQLVSSWKEGGKAPFVIFCPDFWGKSVENSESKSAYSRQNSIRDISPIEAYIVTHTSWNYVEIVELCSFSTFQVSQKYSYLAWSNWPF